MDDRFAVSPFSFPRKLASEVVQKASTVFMQHTLWSKRAPAKCTISTLYTSNIVNFRNKNWLCGAVGVLLMCAYRSPMFLIIACRPNVSGSNN